MKFVIAAKELLALHNLLRDANDMPPTKYGDGDPVPDDVYLRQLYSRVRACLISALTTKNVKDPVETFFSQEQTKIDKLNDGLVNVKKEQLDLAIALKNRTFLVSDGDDDLQAPEYPRKTGRRNFRSGKK